MSVGTREDKVSEGERQTEREGSCDVHDIILTPGFILTKIRGDMDMFQKFIIRLVIIITLHV